MSIYNPGKYYIVSVDETENVCIVSPFNVEKVEQSLAEYVMFSPDHLPPTVTRVQGELYGTMHILKPKGPIDFNNVSYEEIMDIIKE